MEIQGRCYSYEKSIVINALYDTIEALGLCLDNSNSVTGSLTISDAGHTGSMQIALDAAGNTVGTEVTLYTKDPNKTFFNTWASIILDELFGTIQRARCAKREII